MMQKIHKIVAKAAIFSTIWLMVFAGSAQAQAALFGSSSDTLTRLQISTDAEHVISIVLPGGVDFDITTQTDTLKYDFSGDFTLAGTWVAGDFSFTDAGTSKTVSGVVQGAGTIDCTPGVGVDVCVAVDTTTKTFYVEPGAAYASGGAAATLVFTIKGTSAEGATLTNPATASTPAASHHLTITHRDETATLNAATNQDEIGIGITAKDTVAVTADVDPRVIFDIDTGLTNEVDDAGAAATVALGTLLPGTLTTSNQSSVNSIFVDIETNATSGAVVKVKGDTAGLKSDLNNKTLTVAGADTTIAAGTEGFGLCVESVTQTAGTLVAGALYDSTGGACSLTNAGTQKVGDVLTTAVDILTTTSAAIDGGRAEILIKAAIDDRTPPGTDYDVVLTFSAIGTF